MIIQQTPTTQYYTAQELTANNTNKATQELLSEAFYQHFDTTNDEKSTDIKMNIFTGEFYNFSELYSSVDEFKQDIVKNLKGNDFKKDILENDTARQGFMMLGELQQNLADYYHGLDMNASFDLSSGHSNANLTEEQINSIDFQAFILEMISVFSEGRDRAKTTQTDEAVQRYEDILNGYEFLNEALNSISQKEQENKKILAQYTRNI